jgi:hypothetical protein
METAENDHKKNCRIYYLVLLWDLLLLFVITYWPSSAPAHNAPMSVAYLIELILQPM